MSIKNRDIIIYGGLAIAGYFLWKKFSGVAQAAIAPIVGAIANTYVDLTHTAAQATGQLAMPDGSFLPTATMENGTKRWVGNNLLFDLGGTTYSVTSHDANGNYPVTVANQSW